MNTVEALRLGKIDDLCAEYEERGFSIIRDPGQEHVPFDLDLLSPDLLASGPDENVLIFVRESAEWVSMQRLRELMQEVRRYPDWDLLLVTADDIPLVGRAGENVLPSWPELRAQASRAIAFVLSGAEADAAFLVLWAAVDVALRKTAEDADLPIERLPSDHVIPVMYDYGYLSVQQYPRMQALLKLWNRVAHGFPACATELEEGIRDLMDVLTGLLPRDAALAA